MCTSTLLVTGGLINDNDNVTVLSTCSNCNSSSNDHRNAVTNDLPAIHGILKNSTDNNNHNEKNNCMDSTSSSSTTTCGRESSSLPQQHQPSPGKAKKKMNVQFKEGINNNHYCYYHPHPDIQRNELWYTRKDYSRFRQDCETTASVAVNGGSLTNPDLPTPHDDPTAEELCLLGLEHFFLYEYFIQRQKVNAYVRKVVNIQDCQKMMGVQDPEVIAKASILYNQKSTMLAIQRALGSRTVSLLSSSTLVSNNNAKACSTKRTATWMSRQSNTQQPYYFFYWLLVLSPILLLLLLDLKR